ncbi:hypothetical protein ACFSTC_58855 [Nonomuraea ferruginea]
MGADPAAARHPVVHQPGAAARLPQVQLGRAARPLPRRARPARRAVAGRADHHEHDGGRALGHGLLVLRQGGGHRLHRPLPDRPRPAHRPGVRRRLRPLARRRLSRGC